MDTTFKLVGCVSIFLWIIVSIVLATVINGWVLSLMWTWFIVPKFGLPVLGTIEAMLLASIVGLLTSGVSQTRTADTRTTDEKLTDNIGWTIGIIIRPLAALGIFYLIMQWL